MSYEEQYAHALVGTGPRPPNPPRTEPVDLRTVPRERWDEYDCYPLMQPPDVAAWVAGMEEPVSQCQAERYAMEDRIAAFYGITAPWGVQYGRGEFRLQRPDRGPGGRRDHSRTFSTAYGRFTLRPK